MAGEGALLGDGLNPVERLRGRIALLLDLQREGLRLVSEGDVQEIAGWHRQWAALLDEIRTQLDLEAPRQAELVLWPAVNGTQSLEQTRRELVRAAVRCRELFLLACELGGTHDDEAETWDAVPSPQDAHPGSNYVGAGRRFEGAIKLRQIIEAAQESLVVVDPYMDDATFTLAAAAPDGITRRFLTSNYPRVLGRVTQAWRDWRVKWEGESECLATPGNELPHFRLLYVDGAAYVIDSSLKDFGSRLTYIRMLPTDERQRIESETESSWKQAVPV